ncbi:BMP family lipoprotein [Pedosphaera parvula]|uniref:Basic membrane lipoprotein n=1 Tax=Pedosphaera parvula (strain Ellin514) TaxID=320771 RepID=B9XRR0_PEDPL|nr:BMP family ABC transporter substrate-binding protein [Pedosphaera parvula]EEF57475.1 basic membrane lipoprotein [Pedosphaera parvula Ellin514]
MQRFFTQSLKWRAFAMFLFLAGLVFSTPAADFKVGLVLDRGGKDDKSFNSSAYEGANQAKKKLGIFLKYVEATDDNAFEPLLRAFAQRDFDLIIGIGFAQKEAIKKVAAQFPQKHFAIIDAEVDAPNVRSLVFEEHEGAYLIGAIAAMTSKSGKIGFVGGMDIPLIRRFSMAYEAGAKKINPQINVLANFVGVTSEAWNNPPKGKELAVSQYDAGIDIIFAAAGASGLGVFDAAEEKKKFAIGVDANQNWTKPGLILTSMLKRVDEAVASTIEESKAGHFTGGIKRFGLANKGIDYSVDQYNEKILPESVRKRADDIKAEIIAGKIVVPDFYKKK